MTKLEHLARIIERITDADEVHTTALAEEVAELWAAVDSAAEAFTAGAGGALTTRAHEARALRWLADELEEPGAEFPTSTELRAMADQVESGEIVVP